jgi:hypothetical protein
VGVSRAEQETGRRTEQAGTDRTEEKSFPGRTDILRTGTGTGGARHAEYTKQTAALDKTNKQTIDDPANNTAMLHTLIIIEDE